ncbi:hypothetical protein KP509_12G034300 [Ceratopteris richardii]|uniref:DUF2428 domain-containing protein n=1 Tax=Ceratopteris richardii TaxID=49495 RepID=A0A8T2TNH7_CERRI|nr:hypothetical protein KP509_12G034300 [Ceratopteris richardii]
MASSSSKWRALQRRHKWSYDAVRVPLQRLQTLDHLQKKFSQEDPPVGNFISEVLDLLQLTSTHAQVPALKKVLASFQRLIISQKDLTCAEKVISQSLEPLIIVSGSEAGNDVEFPLTNTQSDKLISVSVGTCENSSQCVPVYENSQMVTNEPTSVLPNADGCSHTIITMSFSLLVEILFMENSVPLHRSILSYLAALPSHWKGSVEQALAHCLQEYGIRGAKSRRFAFSAVACSLINLPKPGLLKGIMEGFAATIAFSLSYGVHSLLQESREGGRPTPTAMEDCQGALSCIYYLLVYYPQKLLTPSPHPFSAKSNQLVDAKFTPGGKSVSVYTITLDVILDVLQTNYLSRDCCIAAGVGLCAAMQVNASHSEIACMLASSLFPMHKKNLAILTGDGFTYILKVETQIEAAISEIRGTNLDVEVGKLTDFGRLCVFRGLLTAAPRPALNLNLLFLVKDESPDVKQEYTFSTWNILFNGTLIALCELCESSVDGHFKFHSITSLQICLQQIKTSISMGLTFSAYKELEACKNDVHVLPHHPLSYATIQRILKIVWNNWEDPLSQTVKQIQLAFDLLIDIQCLLLNGSAGSLAIDNEAPDDKATSTGDKIKDFLQSIVKELLSSGGHRKGRYVPLASLSIRLGALNLLDINPDLLSESVNAMIDDDVCCSVGTFLKAFLERLREDCCSLEGSFTRGIFAFRRLSLPPIIVGMVSGNSRLRVNINTYALPIALQIDSDAIFPMLAFALDGVACDGAEGMAGWQEIRGASGLSERLTTNQRVALMIGLLKTARTEALIEGDLCCPEAFSGTDMKFNCNRNGVAIVSIKKIMFQIPLRLLEIAITHSEDSLRIDAAEALCLNPKTASLPSYLELALLKVSIPLNMRCSSTSFRMKWTSLFRKFFLRIRVSYERQIKLDVMRVKAEENGVSEHCLHDSNPACSMPVTAQQMQSFMRWLCNVLLFSLYPSAPYERKSMSMELIMVMLESWSLSNVSLNAVCMGSFSTNDATIVLLSSIVDSWDKLREAAFKILSAYPTPLPGCQTNDEVKTVLTWAMSLVNSPRVRESDAGALVLRLVFQKYVVQLGWILKLHPEHVAVLSQLQKDNEVGDNQSSAVATFLEFLNDWLEWGIVEGEKNLLKACRHSFVHGVLLSYRYTIEELDWKSTSLIAAASKLRVALDRLLKLLIRVTAIALWVVSADAFDISRGLNMSSKPSNIDLQGLLEDDGKVLISDWDEFPSEQNNDEFGFLAPSEQAIMVGCWLAMKEVSLLLGTVTRKVPLPGCDNEQIDEHGKSLSMLDLNQLELIGGHFLQVLLSMKHNGAIDKTRAGFVALCNRLLCSSDARLNNMPEQWLRQLMHRTSAKGQTVDDLLRRSAGIPSAFLALFLSEPEGAPKRLLFVAMRWLIDLVKDFLESSHSENDSVKSSCLHTTVVETDVRDSPVESSLLLKARKEGVVPTVHAFNVLRVTFNDTNLSTDCSGFCAEGLSVAIQAFSSHHWEVRNAAILAFTALLRRMVGFLNDQGHESARKAMTSFEFFHRYPSLHSFLLKELQNATSQLGDESGQVRSVRPSALFKTLHPSLAPVLIILSRLKPSIIKTDKHDWLSPSAFISSVSRCAMQSNMKVRILASRALSPLVAPDQLPDMLYELVDCLPVIGDGDPLQAPGKHTRPLNTSSLTEALKSGQYVLKRPFNTIHGVLLQIHCLLVYNAGTLPANSDIRTKIVSLLDPILSRIDRHFLFTCPMVGAAFLQVLQNLLWLKNTCKPFCGTDGIQNLLLEASASVLDGASCNSSPWDPTVTIMKAKASKCYCEEMLLNWPLAAFNATDVGCHPFQSSSNTLMPDKFLKRLIDCLSHEMYEIRLAVLKALKGFLDLLELKFSKENSSIIIERLEWASRCIQPLIIKYLKVESHPRCMRYLLLTHFTLSMLQLKAPKGLAGCESRTSNCSSSFLGQMRDDEMWKLFVQIYESTKHEKTRHIAICCLSLCIKRITSCLQNSTLQESNCLFCLSIPDRCSLMELSMQFWLDVIQRHSMANEPVMLRRATADAIVASGILEHIQWVGVYYATNQTQPSLPDQHIHSQSQDDSVCSVEAKMAQGVLDAWFVCVKLLEDEDLILRQRLAEAVLHIVSPLSETEWQQDFVPAQVERVIILVFKFLGLHLQHTGAFIEYMTNWVWQRLSDMELLEDDCNLVRRLFDKEADNHHEEVLLFTQLCFQQIQQTADLLRGRNRDQSGTPGVCAHISEILKNWREKFFVHLKAIVEKFCLLESRMQWLGGLTNHPDVFKILYPLLLGLYVFSGLSKDFIVEENVAPVLELCELLRTFVTNPLILNLLLKLLEQHGIQPSPFPIMQGNTFLESFDPFFLL